MGKAQCAWQADGTEEEGSRIRQAELSRLALLEGRLGIFLLPATGIHTGCLEYTQKNKQMIDCRFVLFIFHLGRIER